MTATRLRPEYLPPVTLNTTYALSLNNQPGAADYGYSATHTPGRTVCYTQVPGGFWAVKVRPHDGGWVAFVVPRRGTVADPFTLAHGATRESVLMAAIGWYDTATVAVMHPGRLVFAGTGSATEETVPGYEPEGALS